MMEDNSKIAFAEVYNIIMHSDENIQKRIAPEFINIIKKHMDNSYIPSIDYNKSLENQNIQHETKIILGIIYRDYLCDPDKKKQLIKSENEIFEKIEKEKQEKYSTENLFKNTKYASSSLKSEDSNNLAYKIEEKPKTQNVIIYKKENWYKKIWNSIKSIFKKY